jgi:hypothetical protein
MKARWWLLDRIGSGFLDSTPTCGHRSPARACLCRTTGTRQCTSLQCAGSRQLKPCLPSSAKLHSAPAVLPSGLPAPSVFLP